MVIIVQCRRRDAMSHIDLIHGCRRWGEDSWYILCPSTRLWLRLEKHKDKVLGDQLLFSLSWDCHGPSSLVNHSYIYWFNRQTFIQCPFWIKHSPELPHVMILSFLPPKISHIGCGLSASFSQVLSLSDHDIWPPLSALSVLSCLSILRTNLQI